MTEPRTYPHGVPSWVDTVAHDLDEAKRFYAGLFDWTFTDAIPAEVPGSYLIATIGGQDVAAIASADSDDEAVDVAHLHRRRRRRRHRQGRREGGRHRHAGARRRRARVDGWRHASIPAVPSSGCGRRAAGSARNSSTCRARGTSATCRTTDPHAAAQFYSAVFGWEIDDVGFATMVRSPGYGDHLAATVNPDIRKVQADVMAPPGFEDAVAWMRLVPEGHPETLAGVVHRRRPRRSPRPPPRASAAPSSAPRTPSGPRPPPSATRRAPSSVLSQFTPPKR